MAKPVLRELQLDGLVGPTHNYAGLSFGNIASDLHRGVVSNPREAALEGLAKMRVVAGLGVPQGVLPPPLRPSLSTLRRWGFMGSDEAVLAAATKAEGGRLLRVASSASSMWAANAATVAPSADTSDGRVHFVVANLSSTTHRSLEPETTELALRAIFADTNYFYVDGALPGGALFGDEGAANHTRLEGEYGGVHLFAWGRRAEMPAPTRRFPARQAREASAAVARLLKVEPTRVLFAKQRPEGIDAGGFHTDVLAVGEGAFLLAHEYAFDDEAGLLAELATHVGAPFRVRRVTSNELPVDVAVARYPFNSQLLPLPTGSIAVLAPAECADEPRCRALFDSIMSEDNPVREVHYVDVRQSMRNGGGPACLRLRVALTDDELAAISGRVVVDDAVLDELVAWVNRRYRDRLEPDELADPDLARESMQALDELTSILRLGNLYDFQRLRGAHAGSRNTGRNCGARAYRRG